MGTDALAGVGADFLSLGQASHCITLGESVYMDLTSQEEQ